ncbi:capsular polysaccharide biosynthesis protein [soil metagenome]
MFNFFKHKKNEQLTSFSFLRQDIHSHILPGIDDGSPDIETSLKLIRGLYAAGFRKSIATPHIIGDMFRNNRQTITSALDQLKAACKEEQIDIELGAAAEYMMDDYFLQLLRSGEKLMTIRDNVILTELPYALAPQNLEELSFEILTAGYKPIMAHPERYHYYHNDQKQYEMLKDTGFLLQVNLLSLTGYYGKPVTKAANFIFQQQLADHVGTDMHHEKHLTALTENLELIEKVIGSQEYNNF